MGEKRWIFRRFSKKKIIVLLGDVFSLTCSALIALSIYFDTNMIGIADLTQRPIEMFVYFISIIVIVVAFRYYNLYKIKLIANVIDQIPEIIKSIMIGILFIIIISFFIKDKNILSYSRTHVIIFTFVSFVFVNVNRSILKILFRQEEQENKKYFRRRSIAIGAGKIGEEFALKVKKNSDLFIDLIGFLDDDVSKANCEIGGFKVIGVVTDLTEIIAKYNIDEVFISVQSVSDDEIWDMIESIQRNGCQANLITTTFDVIHQKVDTSEYKQLKSVPVYVSTGFIYRDFLKRQFDLLFSIFLILILFPIFIIIASLIKLTSRGTIFYKTEVIGKGGQKFIWLKFRTMYQNIDQSIHKNYLQEIIRNNKSVEKLKNDDRITRVGKFLRKYSLDELPQFYNVLKGQMSIVGPRPCLQYEYEELKSWQKKRNTVLPGITGLWQISGRGRHDVTFNDSIILDLYYTKNISFWFDFKIIIRTIPVVLFGIGGK